MEYYNNVFCMSKPDLTSGDPSAPMIKDRPIMSDANYDQYVHRYPQVRMRKGGGPGCPALLNYDMLRSDIKAKIFEKYDDVKKFNQRNRLVTLIEPDYKASKYFDDYQFDDGSRICEKKGDRLIEYNNNAMILNAIGRFVMDVSGKQKSMGNKTTKIWQVVSDLVNTLDRTQYPHTLPSNPLRLKEKFNNYLEHGYFHLIHKGSGNDNARRVNEMVERLIISIYCMDNLPFSTRVHDNYLKFLAGSLTIVDRETGVIFDREDFFDERRGTYRTISRGTVHNIIHDPRNAIIIDRLRNNRIDHLTKTTPFVYRKSPTYSLSKISLDDRTLSRKTTDGRWLNLYVAYDVASTAEIACVYSTNRPNVDMVWDCFRELYRTIDENNLVWPGECEVENALMKTIEPQLREMFQIVTFGIPSSSRDRRAEHFHNRKKYDDEKDHQVGIGRWNGKKAFKTKSNSKDDEYKQPRIPLEQLIQEDQESIDRYNNGLHPNQKMYPGKTRWQVLLSNQNPDLAYPNKQKLLKHIGFRTETTIRNNDYCQVMYEKYAIDKQEAIYRLRPNNYSVVAYYLPDRDGSIGNVLIFQGDSFITQATKVERFNESKIEQTEKDEQIRLNQTKRISHFFGLEKKDLNERVTRKLEMFPTENMNDIPAEILVLEDENVPYDESLEELINTYSTEYMESRAEKEF